MISALEMRPLKSERAGDGVPTRESGASCMPCMLVPTLGRPSAGPRGRNWQKRRLNSLNGVSALV